MKIERFPDWQNRFVGYLSEIHRTPFDEQLRHCGFFVGDAVLVMTGFDPLKGLRDAPNLGEMLQRLMERGYEDHVEYVASIFEEVPPMMAGPGDIAVLKGDGGWSLAIVQGDYIYAIGGRGVMMALRSEALRAFKV